MNQERAFVTHGGVLVAILEEIEDHVSACASAGKTPVVDAAHLARTLRALIEHRPALRPLDLGGDRTVNGRDLRILTVGWSWEKVDR